MRVLAHIHTMNDEAFIEQAINALRRQTRPPDAIVIVDNASTDKTLDRPFGDDVTIVRNQKNLGTSGTIRIGFSQALTHGFDWTWVFDADTVPDPDALEKLLAFYQRLPLSQQERVCFLNGWPLTEAGEAKQPAMSLENATLKLIPLEKSRDCTECDCMLWSGSLFRMAAVARIGLPSADYVLDIAEIEYGYRARQLGLTSYIVHDNLIRHDVGRDPRRRASALPVRADQTHVSPDATDPHLLQHAQPNIFLAVSTQAAPHTPTAPLGGGSHRSLDPELRRPAA